MRQAINIVSFESLLQKFALTRIASYLTGVSAFIIQGATICPDIKEGNVCLLQRNTNKGNFI